MRSLFITGTDTGVGKTQVCGLLAGYLHRQGHRVVTQKWVQTGTATGDNDLVVHDRLAGVRASPDADIITARNPYRLSLPASPHLAAAAEGARCDADVIVDRFHQLDEGFDVVLVEGVGGLLVPLNEGQLVVDVAHRLGLAVLVVVANKLGAVNHTLLTLEALRQRDMDVLGLVFNEVLEQDPTVTRDNPEIIHRVSKAPLLGHLCWSPSDEQAIASFETTATRIVAALA